MWHTGHLDCVSQMQERGGMEILWIPAHRESPTHPGGYWSSRSLVRLRGKRSWLVAPWWVWEQVVEPKLMNVLWFESYVKTENIEKAKRIAILYGHFVWSRCLLLDKCGNSHIKSFHYGTLRMHTAFRFLAKEHVRRHWTARTPVSIILRVLSQHLHYH